MVEKPKTIFVQIASYRDPELELTLADLVRQADNPQNLRVAICRQYHPDDDFGHLEKYRNDCRFKIIDVLYTETKGVCWARNQVQQLYNNETYTLQLDSHMRFAKHWDTTLIKMLQNLQSLGHEKPLLTAYVPSYDPKNDPDGRINVPWRMNFDRFIPEGAIFFIPDKIPNWENIDTPVPSRFYSAHMAFTLGIFSKEVQHNPDYYFHGEEISITVRAFTHGYDLFHPHKVVIWHEYTRRGRDKQWDDDPSWGSKNSISHLTNRKLFGMDGEVQEGHEGLYGFGKVRTLKQYEEFAGIRFHDRCVQQYTLDKHYPPNPGPSEIGGSEAWKNSFMPYFKHCIDIGFADVPEKDYDFWAVAFHDAQDNTIYRQDADKEEIYRIMNDPDGYCKIWREFITSVEPHYWVVWPHSESKGWCQRLSKKI